MSESFFNNVRIRLHARVRGQYYTLDASEEATEHMERGFALLQIAHKHDMQKMGRRCGDQMWEHGKALGEGDLEQAKKSEYHRGYTDGLHARDTATWQLDQERQEVAFSIAKIDSDAGGFVKALGKALGIDWQAPRASRNLALIRDRLIHLMGYEQSDMVNCGNPYKEGGAVLDAGVITSMEHDEARSNDAEPTCQKPRKPSISDEESESKLSKSADMTNKTSIDGTATNRDGTRPNPVQSASITAELREFATKFGKYDFGGVRNDLSAIADAIDAEFAKLAYERNHFEHERDYWHQVATDNMNRADDMEQELDNLTEALAELHANPLEDELVKVENERDQLATKVENQRKRLNQLENIVNTWHYEDGRYFSPIAADKAVRKANKRADKMRDERDYWHQKATGNIQRPYGRA